MDWLTHNPLADIHGPAFLPVYGAIALVIIIAAYRSVRARDDTDWREPPPVAAEIDPYELAYFRGGVEAVIRTAVYALHQRGLVTIIPKEKSRPSRLAAVAAPDAGRLTAIEKRIVESLGQPADPSPLFVGKTGTDVAKLCEPYRQKLESEQLLRTADARWTTIQIPLAASAALVALTAYKIAVAEGRPFGFLIVLTIVALGVLWGFVGPVAGARMTARGNAYLKRLHVAYGNAQQPEAHATGPSPQNGEPDAISVVMVGLFGLGILNSTPDAAVADVFAKNAASGGYGGAFSNPAAGGSCGGGSGGSGGGGGRGCGS